MRIRPDLVVAQLSHENVLVDGLSAVIERLRDAERIAQLRALPRNDDQRLRRFLISQNRHARERLRVGVGLGGFAFRARSASRSVVF